VLNIVNKVVSLLKVKIAKQNKWSFYEGNTCAKTPHQNASGWHGIAMSMLGCSG